MTVKARDDDPGENGRVTYHFKVNDSNVQETDEFTINEETGELRSKIILDRETKKQYQVSTQRTFLILRNKFSLCQFLYFSLLVI